MKKMQNTLLFLLCLGLLTLPFSCEKDDLLLNENLEATEIGGGGSAGMIELIDVDFSPYSGYYVVSGKDAGGDVDTYFGRTRNWTKVADNRDVSEIKGTYVGTAFADDDNFTNFSIHNGRVNSNQGFTPNGTGGPRSNSGGAVIGDLVEFIDADYDSDNGYYVVSGKDAGGDVDTYFGRTRNWTKVSDNRDVSEIKGTYVGTAFADDGNFTNFSIHNGRLNSNQGFTPAGTGGPRSNSGGAVIGDLVELISAEYDSDHGYYVVSGKDAGGEVDTYYGRTRNWTKVSDRNDANNIFGTYLATAFADNGTFVNISLRNGRIFSNQGFTANSKSGPKSNRGSAIIN